MSKTAPGLWRVYPTYSSNLTISQMCYGLGLDSNSLPTFHATLAFDNNNPDNGDQPKPSVVYDAEIVGFRLMGENKDVLAAVLHSPQLEARHKELHASGLRKWDWPSYEPHITLIKRNARESELEHISQMFPNKIAITLTGESCDYAQVR